MTTRLEQWAQGIASGVRPQDAAAEIRGEYDREPVRRITGVLLRQRVPLQDAIAKARNLVSVLDVLEPEADRIAEIGSSLLRDDTVPVSVVHEVAREVMREWERSEVEASL